MEIARQKIDDDVWKRGRPREVNALIKTLLDDREIFKHAIADEPESGSGMPDIDSIPPQVTAASRFAIDTEGRIDLSRDPPNHATLADAMQREIYQEV